MWLQVHGNFTYAHSEFLKYEEPEYNEKYKLHVGQSLNQEFGYIAERLFIDDADVANSPKQTFGESPIVEGIDSLSIRILVRCSVK